MPPEIEPVADDDPPADDAPPAAPAASPAVPSSDAVRNSPEYKEIQRQNRLLARQAGTASRAEATARRDAEAARVAAEAQEQADLEAEIATTLGEDGLTAYNEIAELTASNPRAAARKLAELIAQARAQTPVPPIVDDAPPAPAPEGGAPVPGTPPPPRGLGADAPLGAAPAATDPTAQIITDLESRYGDVVTRVNDPATRNRVTMRDRAEGFISYLGAAVLKAGARPTNKS